MRKYPLLFSATAITLAASLLTGCSGSQSQPAATAAEAQPAATESESQSVAEASQSVAEEADSIEQTDRDPGEAWTWSELKENVTADTATDPKTDFHLYVNKDWIIENELPDGYSSYSQYAARQLDVDDEAMALLTDTSLEGENAELLREMYKTVLDWDTRNEIGYAPLIENLSKIEQIRTLDDLTAYMTDTSAGYHYTIFECYSEADMENSTVNILYLSQSSLLLGDAAEYTERTENGQLLYEIYKQIFEYMMNNLGTDAETADAMYDEAISFETKLAELSYTTEDMYQIDYYDRVINKMTPQEVIGLCPDYPMEAVLKSRRLDTVDIIDVEKPDYFEGLNDLYIAENLDAIKDLLIVKSVCGSRSYLDEATYRNTRQIINDLYGISGTISDEKMAYSIVSSLMPIQLQQLYVQKYGSEEKRELITETCEAVIATYEEMLLANDYLTPETIEAAVEKLRSIRINSLYPDKWPDISDCNMKGLSLYDAVRESSRFATQYNLSKVGTSPDPEMWIDLDSGISLLECNAFYNPLDNSINMILGMMGAPFYNEEMGDEELFASLGAFWIGHEISHAFDSDGSQYDKDGNYYDWWTEEDRANFEARIAKLDEYLSRIEIDDGYFVNGSNVDTEMAADYTGLQCALKMAEAKEDFDYDLFFRTYASMNASISVRSAEISQLLTDSHPLDFLRTNVPVQQFEEFYHTYDVKEGDGMYLAPEDRLLIW